MSFMLYIVGLMVMLGGLIWAASTMDIPQTYVAIGAVVILGMGIMSAVAQTRRKDSDGGSETTVIKSE